MHAAKRCATMGSPQGAASGKGRQTAPSCDMPPSIGCAPSGGAVEEALQAARAAVRTIRRSFMMHPPLST
jgi:hypothetical protein